MTSRAWEDRAMQLAGGTLVVTRRCQINSTTPVHAMNATVVVKRHTQQLSSVSFHGPERSATPESTKA
jgi:hypothetical protein